MLFVVVLSENLIIHKISTKTKILTRPTTVYKVNQVLQTGRNKVSEALLQVLEGFCSYMWRLYRMAEHHTFIPCRQTKRQWREEQKGKYITPACCVQSPTILHHGS